MPITVNNNDVLNHLTDVFVNNDGVLNRLTEIYINDGGIKPKPIGNFKPDDIEVYWGGYTGANNPNNSYLIANFTIHSPVYFSYELTSNDIALTLLSNLPTDEILSNLDFYANKPITVERTLYLKFRLNNKSFNKTYQSTYLRNPDGVWIWQIRSAITGKDTYSAYCDPVSLSEGDYNVYVNNYVMDYVTYYYMPNGSTSPTSKSTYKYHPLDGMFANYKLKFQSP